jgi:hypothetical protein
LVVVCHFQVAHKMPLQKLETGTRKLLRN